MSSATLYRASGLALLLGALLFIIGNVLSTVLFPGNSTPTQLSSALYVSVSVLSFIGGSLLLLGLPGIVARQAARAGWLGLVGFILTILGGLLFTSFTVVSFLILPWLAVIAPQSAAQLTSANGPPAFFVYFLVASLLNAVGGVLLGIATMRARVLPQWAGLLIIVSAVLLLVAFPLTGIISSIVSIVASVLFALGLGRIGYALWTTKGETL